MFRNYFRQVVKRGYLIGIFAIALLSYACNSDSDYIPKAYRGPDGVYYSNDGNSNLKLTISGNGKYWSGSGTLPWGESAHFSGDIERNGDLISRASNNKSGKITYYDDYVSSVYFLNYRMWRKGEQKWREESAKKEQELLEKKRQNRKPLFKEGSYYMTPDTSSIMEVRKDGFEFRLWGKNGVVNSYEYLGHGEYQPLDDGLSGHIRKGWGKRIIIKNSYDDKYTYLPCAKEVLQKLIKIDDEDLWIVGDWINEWHRHDILNEGHLFHFSGDNTFTEKLLDNVSTLNDSTSNTFNGYFFFDISAYQVRYIKLIYDSGVQKRFTFKENISISDYDSDLVAYSYPDWLDGVWEYSSLERGLFRVIIKKGKANVMYGDQLIAYGFISFNDSGIDIKYNSNLHFALDINRDKNCVKVNKTVRGEWGSQWMVKTAEAPERDLIFGYTDPETVLSIIYPSTPNAGGLFDHSLCITERFDFYESIESDHDVLLQTQDAYTYVDNPDPKFTKYDKMDNAYLVEWTQSADNPRQQLVVIFIQENGAWKIDNVIEHPDADQAQVLFDYSKPPVPVYEEGAYSDEDLKRIEQIRESLETKNEG